MRCSDWSSDVCSSDLAGHDLTLYDTDPGAYDRLDDRLFTRVESPRAVADACKIVFFCLPSLLAIRTAVMGPDGILSGSRVEIVANSSTSGTAVVDEIVAAGAERRVRKIGRAHV